MAKKKTSKSKPPLFKDYVREFGPHNKHIQELAKAILECTDPKEVPELASSYLKSVGYSLEWLYDMVRDSKVPFQFTVRIRTGDEKITIPYAYPNQDGKRDYRDIQAVDKQTRASRKAKKASGKGKYKTPVDLD